jgi:hypothetical protein
MPTVSEEKDTQDMKTAVAHLKNISPYSQSRHYTLPERSQKETHADYEKRTWRERMHVTDDGHIFVPPMAFKNCLSEAAKFLSRRIPGKGKATYTKHFEAGVLVTDGLILPLKKEEAEGQWLFVPADGKRGSGSRVDKCFPVIKNWEGDVTFFVLDDTIDKEAFEEHLKEAGQFIGIGYFRPRNNGYWGRFSVESITWS